MILISHRGNTIGPMPSCENEPTYIDKAISEGFEVEVDVWFIETEQSGWQLFLGHDEPQYGVTPNWFTERTTKLWIHCKNIEAIEFFSATHSHYFWHQTDTVTLTSNNYIWAYPGNQPIKGSIAVMPETLDEDLSKCIGVCSDYIQKYTGVAKLVNTGY